MTNQTPTKVSIATLIESGLSVRQVANLMNISTQAVYKHLRRLGITPPTKRKHD
jgi:DNA-binding CsgD family transcriptional regulator